MDPTSTRHRSSRGVEETAFFPTNFNFQPPYANHTSSTKDTHERYTPQQLMYEAPQITYNPAALPSSFQFGSEQADYSLFESSYPADWGMQFQGQDSNSLGGGVSAARQGSSQQQQQSYSQQKSQGQNHSQSQNQSQNLLPRNKAGNGHSRTVSESTVNSAGPSSPYTQSFSNPYIATDEHSPNSASTTSHFDEASSIFQKQLPSQEQFAQYSSVGYMPSQLSHTPAVHLDMKHMVMDQHNASADDMPDFSHSSRQSVSSRGQDSPSTPKMDGTKVEDEDVQESRPALFKIPTNGERHKEPDFVEDFCLYLDSLTDYRQGAPRVELFRTESAAAADELYNPDFAQPSAPSTHLQPQPQKNFDANHLSPNRNLVQDRIRTANSARSNSPQQSSSSRRDKSPFRPGSPLAPQGDAFKSPSTFFTSAADARRMAVEEASQREVARHNIKPSLHREPTKTMSPRDAVLDYEADLAADMPLFPDAMPVGYQKHQGAPDFFTTNYLNGTGQGFGTLATQGHQTQNMGSFRPQDGLSGTTNDSSDFSFLPPQQQQQQQQQPVQQQSVPSQHPSNPYTAPQYRPTGFLHTNEQTPDFPAHLTSMESSISDAPMSSQESSATSDPAAILQRPSDTSAATGGYTCTFHNCVSRFDSPAKLQKHKREIHHTNHSRDVSASLSSVPPTTTAPSTNPSVSPDPSHDGSDMSVGSVGSGMTSAALAARNSQAGPHKCTRINPSTGKPCNSIFSRPYDLTRHEDTIHNRQKQKVRCQYCREEKTFSRNDALTRHMRVVHPDVNWEAKRGGRGGSAF